MPTLDGAGQTKSITKELRQAMSRPNSPLPGEKSPPGTPQLGGVANWTGGLMTSQIQSTTMADIEKLDTSSGLARWLERFEVLAELHGWTE